VSTSALVGVSGILGLFDEQTWNAKPALAHEMVEHVAFAADAEFVDVVEAFIAYRQHACEAFAENVPGLVQSMAVIGGVAVSRTAIQIEDANINALIVLPRCLAREVVEGFVFPPENVVGVVVREVETVEAAILQIRCVS
jgi:hypothetical protein